MLLPGNQDAGAAHVQKVAACELFEPGPQGVHTTATGYGYGVAARRGYAVRSASGKV